MMSNNQTELANVYAGTWVSKEALYRDIIEDDLVMYEGKKDAKVGRVERIEYGELWLSNDEIVPSYLIVAVQIGNNPRAIFNRVTIIEKAYEEASKVLGVDPAYYGEEGEEEVRKQIIKQGYNPDEVLKK